MEFEWDHVKARSNFKKHNVSFEEAMETFSDPEGIQLDDYLHSQNEIRHYWIGKTANGRILTSWFTKREDVIRLIGSASWRKFRRYYETTQIK